MDDLVRWLGEQLDEDERIARDAADELDGLSLGSEWRYDGQYVETVRERTMVAVGSQDFMEPRVGTHIAAHDPARVLREIEADRLLLAQYAEVAANDVNEVEYAHGWANALGLAVRLRATAYRDRPGYRAEEWAP